MIERVLHPLGTGGGRRIPRVAVGNHAVSQVPGGGLLLCASAEPVLAGAGRAVGRGDARGHAGAPGVRRRHHIALWDVLRACSIEGADDGSIRQPEVNDLRQVLERADIRAIFTTGAKAAALYKRYCLR